MSHESSPETIRNILSHIPLFHTLAPKHLDQIVAETKEIRLNKGEVLFRKGAPALGFYVVTFGQIKLGITSPQGNEKVVEIIGARQSFGEAAMFLSTVYPVTAEALADSLILYVSRKSVDQLLTQDPTFAHAMLAGLSFRLHSLIHDVESYSMRSSTQRVIGYLLQQCPEQPRGAVEVSLPTSKMVIASRLNLTPETLSRVFHDLAQNGLIEVDGRMIRILDPLQLREFDI